MREPGCAPTMGSANAPLNHIRIQVALAILCCALSCLFVDALATTETTFGLDIVEARAIKLAQGAYQRPKSPVPRFLLPKGEDDPDIYDTYRKIRFRSEKALWADAGLPFQVQMFHPGLHFPHPVELYVVAEGHIEKVSFSTAMFDYADLGFEDKIPAELGFAGFRIHTPFKKPSYYDEATVFLGASYFRAVGSNQYYGLSARGLAIDTALPAGEEFPDFKAFWLVKPKPEYQSITVYALLDSPGIAGAYRFVITPGIETVMDVEARLYPRHRISKLGIAPLTSMYHYAENSTARPADYRPEVHDSDGLIIHTASGEWIWRPLQNNRNLLINVFSLNNPRGFGLLQRDRNFDHYQDLESRYDRRPNAWVTPLGEWGEGHVELIQIPTQDEYHDNVVAFWVPKSAPESGKLIHRSYRLRWFLHDPLIPGGGHVVATRTAAGTAPNARKFVLDFAGGELESLTADSGVEAIIDVGENGRLLEHQLMKNDVTQGWRLVFQVRMDKDRPLELRVSLKQDQNFLTETWTYTIAP